MKQLLFLTLFIFVQTIYAQVTDSIFNERLDSVEKRILTQEAKLSDLTKKYNIEHGKLSRLSNQLKENNLNLTKHIDSLNEVIDGIETNSETIKTSLSSRIDSTQQAAKSEIEILDKNLDDSKLHSLLMAILILIIIVAIYFLLRKNVKNNSGSLEKKLNQTRLELESEGLKLDEKLIHLLEAQIKQQSESPEGNGQNEVDHTLILKVSEEINRIQKNLSRLDDSTKGLKPIEKGIERLINNFAANGYEILNLLHKDFDERMNVDVIQFIDDENIPEGKRIITRVLKPQVNFNNVLIQRAQVEVSQNI